MAPIITGGEAFWGTKPGKINNTKKAVVSRTKKRIEVIIGKGDPENVRVKRNHQAGAKTVWKKAISDN